MNATAYDTTTAQFSTTEARDAAVANLYRMADALIERGDLELAEQARDEAEALIVLPLSVRTKVTHRLLRNPRRRLAALRHLCRMKGDHTPTTTHLKERIMTATRTHATEYVTSVIEAGDATRDEYDIDGIVDEVHEEIGTFDFDFMDTDEGRESGSAEMFWAAVERHAL